MLDITDANYVRAKKILKNFEEIIMVIWSKQYIIVR